MAETQKLKYLPRDEKRLALLAKWSKKAFPESFTTKAEIPYTDLFLAFINDLEEIRIGE